MARAAANSFYSLLAILRPEKHHVRLTTVLEAGLFGMANISVFVIATIPVMVLLGMRHALDVDHIAAIDNLVRLRNSAKSARWIGSLFSIGHMVAVCTEMVALVYVVKSLQAQASLQLLGGILGA